MGHSSQKGGRIMGAEIHARHAREEARKAVREADRAEARAWSMRMEGYGGPAQPSPTIGQCLDGGLGWLEVECNRCKTRASLPHGAIRHPRDTPIQRARARSRKTCAFELGNQFSTMLGLFLRPWGLGRTMPEREGCERLSVAAPFLRFGLSS
jgi:ribosomal protein L44E